MHFLHIFSPPARGQPKGNVKLTVGDCFIFLCTVCRDLNPMVAINIVYRTYVLLSTNFAFTRNPDKVFILLKFTSNFYTNFFYSAGNVPDCHSQLHPIRRSCLSHLSMFFWITSFASVSGPKALRQDTDRLIPDVPMIKKSAVNYGYIHIAFRCCRFGNCLECNMFVSCPLRIMGRYEICY